MTEPRFSMWVDMIDEFKHRISDIGELEGFTGEKCVETLQRGIAKLPNIQGMSNNVMVPFSFEPVTSTGGIDEELYENHSNIEMNYYITLEDSGSEGYIESRAALIEGRQIALLKMTWNQDGTTGPPVLDISVDKSPTKGDVRAGSWLVADGRLGALENSRSVDISTIPSPSFSFKWTFPSGSDYKVRETIAEMFLVDIMRVRENKTAIVAAAASIVFTERAVAAGERGVSKDYIETLYKHADTAWDEVRNSLGGGAAPTTGASAMDSGYDRDTYANRAFRKNTSLVDGQWVEVTNRGVDGIRVIRVIH